MTHANSMLSNDAANLDWIWKNPF